MRPIPYPSSRSHAEWDAFLNGLYQTWGDAWAKPDPRGTSRKVRDVPGSASFLQTNSHLSVDASLTLAAGIDRVAFTFPYVQVRSAMTLRLGSFALSRISITTRLVIWFLCLSLIPCVVLTGIISYLSNQSLKRTVRQGLLAVSDAKTTQLETFIRERRGDLSVASRYPAIVAAIPKLKQVRQKEAIDSPAYLELARSVHPFMANFVDSFGYSNAYLFDTDGTLLYQLKSDLDIGSNLLTGRSRTASWPRYLTGFAPCCKSRSRITRCTLAEASRQHSLPVRSSTLKD